MSTVNYLLLYKGNSSNGGHEAAVRGFSLLESARCAMAESYRELAASMNISPSSRTPGSRYTVRTENSIRLERYGDVFVWEIIRAVPEDGPDGGNGRNRRYGLKKFTVTIEKHISQEFPIQAHDIFLALRTAEQAYSEGSLVVQPSTPNSRLIMARDDATGETSEWKEF